jgi:hypothetical protein
MHKSWWLAAAGLGIAVLIVAGFLLFRPGGPPAFIDYYRIVDEDTIVIGTGGGNDEETRVTDVVESDERVTITARSFTTNFGMGNDLGIPIELEVELDAPLGDRGVFDPHHEVPRVESAP